MAEEAKTYVFGNDGASSMWPLAFAGNNGFGGNGWGGGILVGNIIYEMYDSAKDFLCEHCRLINFYNFGKVKIKMKKEG